MLAYQTKYDEETKQNGGRNTCRKWAADYISPIVMTCWNNKPMIWCLHSYWTWSPLPGQAGVRLSWVAQPIEILRSEDALASALLIWQELTEAPKSAWTAKAPGDASIPYYSRIQGFDFRASTSIPSARLGREALLLRKEQLGH